MSLEKIWLSSPHMGESEQEFVNQAFVTNWIAPLGPHVDGFERDLQQYNKVGHAAALSSGTGAIHIALDLLGVKPGDYVLVQSFTFCGSANPVLYKGAIPIFIDSETDTWNMSAVHLEEAIKEINNNSDKSHSGKIKAIIPVHLYGMPAKIDEIKAVAEKYNIPIIEDAAESLGSTYKGRFTGTFGNLGVYSFNGNKIITTSGGGALVSDNKDMIDKARFLATQARDQAPHYQHTEVGYNYRLSNVLAGIGRGQMEVLPQRIQQRRANFKRYYEYFNKWNGKGFNIRFQEENSYSFSNRWLTCILVNPDENRGLSREEIRLALQEKNIESRPLWKPMHLQPVFKDYPFYGGRASEELFDKGLCLPSGSNLLDEDFKKIFEVLDLVFDKYLQKI